MTTSIWKSEKFAQTIQTILEDYGQISDQRKDELHGLASLIKKQIDEQDISNLIFVCTHNSRRSQLAEFWMRTACTYFGLENINSFSGGTEATAFNHRMVNALKRVGVAVTHLDENENTRYKLTTSDSVHSDPIMFSKKYDDEFNPTKDFIAVMVCGQADQDCPFVPDAYGRFSLPYEDPKNFDDTEQESEAYDLKVNEIGKEIFYLVQTLTKL